MARKKKTDSLESYLEEKKKKRIDPAQLTIVKESDETIDHIKRIEKNLGIPVKFKSVVKGKRIPKPKDIEALKDGVVAGTEIVYSDPNAKSSIPRRIYNFFFGWVFTKKTDSENILQHAIRQFLPPDSSGKPSWQLLIVLWSLVLMSYVTATEIQVALSYITTYNDKGILLSKKMHGFSEAFIYFVIIFAGAVTTLFHKREKQRKDADGTNAAPTADEATGGIFTNIKERIGSMIGKK